MPPAKYGLLLDLSRAASLLQQTVSAEVVDLGIGGPEAWILVLLAEAGPAGKTGAELDTLLGFAAKRSRHNIRRLEVRRLVALLPPGPPDRKRKAYVLTARGRKQAEAVRIRLEVLEATIRKDGKIPANLRTVDLQRVSAALVWRDLPLQPRALPAGLDSERLRDKQGRRMSGALEE